MTIVIGGVTAGLVSLPAQASRGACRRVQVPNLGAGDNALEGVAVVSPNDAWAVGYFTRTSTSRSAALIEHWNGSAWRIEPSPTPRGGKGNLTRLVSVAAVSSHDVWAVGYIGVDGVTTTRALIEHWNGRTWRIQRNGTRGFSELLAVAATSPTNAWAVGMSRSGGLIEHWNGRAWKIQASPRLKFSHLLGVTATSLRNAWAVGVDQTGAKTIIEHWNGRRWTIQASPTVKFPPNGGDVLSQGVQLSGVAATSSNSAWAVGYAETFGHGSGDEVTQIVIEHWNGRAWKLQRGADMSDTTNQLFGVAATSSRNAWAVGGSLAGVTIQHRTGGTWIAQTGPAGKLFSVAATSSTSVWAVGTFYDFNASAYRTLTVRCR